MYEAVHARPEGTATVARLAHDAADCGYDGVVVRNHDDAGADYDAAAVRDASDVDVVDAVEIRADDPTAASGAVGNYRPKHTLVCVHGGTDAINRFACEQERVDVLCHPLAEGGELNHVLAKAATRNGVRVELNLRRVLRATGGRRVQFLDAVERLWRVLDHHDTPFVVSADPTSHLHLRGPRELVALGEVCGLDGETVREGLREWGRLAERNRRRDSERFIEPGVERGRYEEDDR
jgi:ribonuclease P/MRP protein subunit RPP1